MDACGGNIGLIYLAEKGIDQTKNKEFPNKLEPKDFLYCFAKAPGSLYYILLLPLVRLGYVNTMVPLVVIPEFVFGEMRKTPLGVAGLG